MVQPVNTDVFFPHVDGVHHGEPRGAFWPPKSGLVDLTGVFMNRTICGVTKLNPPVGSAIANRKTVGKWNVCPLKLGDEEGQGDSVSQDMALWVTEFLEKVGHDHVAIEVFGVATKIFL
jgi:hypothetical protein